MRFGEKTRQKDLYSFKKKSAQSDNFHKFHGYFKFRPNATYNYSFSKIVVKPVKVGQGDFFLNLLRFSA